MNVLENSTLPLFTMKYIVALILLALLAMLLNLTMLVYAFYVIVAMLLISRWVTRDWAEAVEAERVCHSESVAIGGTISVMIKIRHTGRWPITWVLVEDLLEARGARRSRALHFQFPVARLEVLKLNPGEQKQLIYQLKCNKRGYFQVGPLVLETGDMFGLNRRYRVLTDPIFILVLPNTIAIPNYDIASRRPIGEVVMTHRLFEDPTRISGVRRYQNGDPLSRVHWRATARTGKLQSKTYEPSTLSGATIVVDFHRDSFDPKHEPVRSELAITAAASIANSLHELGQQVGLVSNGRDAVDRIRTQGWKGDRRTRAEAQQSVQMKSDSDRLLPVIVPTGNSADQMLNILRTLARLELTDGLELGQLLVESTARMPRDATVLVILSAVNLANAVAIGGLRRQGYAVEVIVNCLDEQEFLTVSGPLLNEGITTRFLQNEASIAAICERQLIG